MAAFRCNRFITLRITPGIRCRKWACPEHFYTWRTRRAALSAGGRIQYAGLGTVGRGVKSRAQWARTWLGHVPGDIAAAPRQGSAALDPGRVGLAE